MGAFPYPFRTSISGNTALDGALAANFDAASTEAWVTSAIADAVAGVTAGIVTDHGTLTGLSDDDHPQYHNDARGDARYSLLGHGHTGTYQPLDADLTTIATLDSGTSAGVMTTDASGWVKKSYAAFKTLLVLVKGDVGLGNVDNTSDANKPVSTAQQTALDLKATVVALDAEAATRAAGVVAVQQDVDDLATDFEVHHHDTRYYTKVANDALLAAYLTSAAATLAYQPLDSDLTTIAGLTATTDSFMQAKAGAWAARTISQVKTDLAISNVDNTSDANKPVSTATQTALNLKANLATAVMDGDTAGGVLAGTFPNPSFASDMATQAELDAHINDTSAAHAAAAISITDTGGYYTNTNVDMVLQEIGAELIGVAWTHRGAFDAGISPSYQVNDVVEYAGSSWLCNELGTVETPSELDSSWSLIARKGDTGLTGSAGAAGSSLTVGGAYSGATAYAALSVVSYNGSSYVRNSTGPGSSGILPTDTTYWTLVASKGDTGTAGTNGSNGADGVDTGISYTFDTTTTMADPGAGKIRFNNSAPASTTQIAMDLLDADASDLSVLLASWDDSTGTIKGTLTIRQAAAPTKFLVADITSATVSAGHVVFTVTAMAAGATPTNGATMLVTFARAGNTGATGPVDTTTATNLATHIANATGAHAASAISVIPAGRIVSAMETQANLVRLEQGIVDLQDEFTGHHHDERYRGEVAGGYAEITASFTSATLNASYSTAAITMTITGDGVTPVMIEAWMQSVYYSTLASNSQVRTQIWDGTIGSGTLLAGSDIIEASANNPRGAVNIKRRIAAFSGSKTITLAVRQDSAVNCVAVIEAGSTSPAFLRATYAN